MLNPSLIKAVAIDCDGTLINSQEILTPYTKEVLYALKQTGRKAYMVTGRSTAAALPHALNAGLDEYLITYNGGVIWHVPHEKALVKHILSRDVFLGIAGILRDSDMGYAAYADDKSFYENTHPITERYVERLREFKTNPAFMPFEDLTANPQKILAFGSDDEAKEVNQRIQAEFGRDIHSIVTQPYAHNKVVTERHTFIEVMPQGVDKSIALGELAQMQGFSLENVMAFGDDTNDMGMVSTVGWGVAMGNGRDELKSAAKDITLKHDEDGVAHYIEKYLL